MKVQVKIHMKIEVSLRVACLRNVGLAPTVWVPEAAEPLLLLLLSLLLLLAVRPSACHVATATSALFLRFNPL